MRDARAFEGPEDRVKNGGSWRRSLGIVLVQEADKLLNIFECLVCALAKMLKSSLSLSLAKHQENSLDLSGAPRPRRAQLAP